LRAIAADLAAKGWLSPSKQPYLPGSIARMVRSGAVFDYAALPTHLAVVDDPDIEIDVEDDTATNQVVDAIPTLRAVVVDAAPPAVALEDAQPVVDAAPLPSAAPSLTPQPVVDARRSAGPLTFRSLLVHMRDTMTDADVDAAMATVGLTGHQLIVLDKHPELLAAVARAVGYPE
jgi:hypothetical protein